MLQCVVCMSVGPRSDRRRGTARSTRFHWRQPPCLNAPHPFDAGSGPPDLTGLWFGVPVSSADLSARRTFGRPKVRFNLPPPPPRLCHTKNAPTPCRALRVKRGHGQGLGGGS